MAEATFDTTVWREKASPLIAAAGSGPLSGHTVAVKDLFAVAGHRIGLGNPEYLHQSSPELAHAEAVAKLVEAGAEVAGIAQTAEFAWSLTGINPHYGTPPNPAAPGRIPGGSSSGSATAVATGEASIGLGTDTGGSVRVPAAYQGLWGLRPTHGLVAPGGMRALAPSFDTIGWMTRDVQTLAAVAEVLITRPRKLPQVPSAMGGMGATGTLPVISKTPPAWDPERGFDGLLVAPSTFAGLSPEVKRALTELITELETAHRVGAHETAAITEADLETWAQAYTTVLCREAWTEHGAWVEENLESFNSLAGSRFLAAAEVTADQEVTARDQISAAREKLRHVLGHQVLAVPTVPTPAPPVEDAESEQDTAQAIRSRALEVTAIASVTGLPALNVPTTTAEGLPVGLSLIGPPGSDKALIHYARECGR